MIFGVHIYRARCGVVQCLFDLGRNGLTVLTREGVSLCVVIRILLRNQSIGGGAGGHAPWVPLEVFTKQ